MELGEVAVEPVAAKDEGRYQRLMGAHHYLRFKAPLPPEFDTFRPAGVGIEPTPAGT